MSERLLVATRKGLIEFRREGAGRWRHDKAHFLGSPVSNVLRDPRDGALYAALDLGHFGVKLHRSDDDGASWTEVGVPSYEGVGGEDPPALKLLWTIEPGGTDEPGVLWAGTIPGGLFRSADRGETWTLIRSLWDQPSRQKWFGGGYDQPGIHSICVDPRDSRRISLAVSCGGVWESLDGGDSWSIGCKGMWAEYWPPEQKDDPDIQDPHRMVRCPTAPDSYWVQHHNGIFRSTTGMDGWSEVKAKPSSFGFAVAVHPEDPDTAWFAPAVKDEFRYPADGRFIVNRTRDGGRSFEALSEGLPQQNSYDLVYRHGLDIDGSGERLAMGSTTGNLWLTENGGNSWATLSGHLPPIYAVRFA